LTLHRINDIIFYIRVKGWTTNNYYTKFLKKNKQFWEKNYLFTKI